MSNTVKVVVEIPKETYLEIRSGFMARNAMESADAIRKGIPLPKGHGRLIDANSLLEYGACPNSCGGTATCMEDYEHLHCPIRVFDIESINDTPTIIEADKGGGS